MGKVYQKFKFYETAASCYNKGLLTLNNRDVNSMLSVVISNIASIYAELSDHKKAYGFLKIALSKVADSESRLKSDIFLLIGQSFLHLQLWKECWSSLYSALCVYQISQKCYPITLALAEVHYSIAALLLHLGSVSQSFAHVQLALELATSLLDDTENTTPQCREVYRQAKSLTQSLQLVKVCQHNFASLTIVENSWVV